MNKITKKKKIDDKDTHRNGVNILHRIYWWIENLKAKQNNCNAVRPNSKSLRMVLLF